MIVCDCLSESTWSGHRTASVVTTQALASAADVPPDAGLVMIARNAATAMVQQLFIPDAQSAAHRRHIKNSLLNDMHIPDAYSAA